MKEQTTFTAQERFKQTFLSGLFIAAISGLFYLILHLLFGLQSPLLFLAGIGVLWFIQFSRGSLYLKYLRAKELSYVAVPEIYEITQRLSAKAGLEETPLLYYAPSTSPNAFTMRLGKKNAIIMTGALISGLNERELSGVLAHEIAHIANKDLQLLGLSGSIHSGVLLLSSVARIPLLLTGFVLLLTGQLTGGFIAGLIATWTAPMVVSLLFFATSRSRERLADLAAVELTQDAYGLASALQKIERSNPWEFFTKIRVPVWLQSHPDISERIHILKKIIQRQKIQRMPLFFSSMH